MRVLKTSKTYITEDNDRIFSQKYRLNCNNSMLLDTGKLGIVETKSTLPLNSNTIPIRVILSISRRKEETYWYWPKNCLIKINFRPEYEGKLVADRRLR